ncbi:hypothetical protein EIP91_006971 [Steccherinum ochraceum]|uniref:Peptidase S9 prolyl oligopeptidase catalytic domain-containing protein n=1 Tax=Steccherinum ochraceum TaxID=92696 RepID=A0A4R0R4Y7_9APHY|nr:hypothetical protein EIP91_006971 [Steccherinum ochraceum]
MTNTLCRIAAFGTWKSPVTAAEIAAQSLTGGLEDIYLDKASSEVYLAQNRPDENGRSAVVDAVNRKDVLGKQWNTRTRVHEYGGAAATLYDGSLYFSHFGDNRVYVKVKGTNEVRPITPEQSSHRYADFTVHPVRTNLLVGICEDHSDPHPARVVTTLALINAETSSTITLFFGADFYACPRFSPDGTALVWQQWWHPDMPQQSAEIKVASVTLTADGSLTVGDTVHVAGKPTEVVAQDPEWTSPTSLHFICDVNGYLNPWKFEFSKNDVGGGTASPIFKEPILEEFGAPQWWLSRHGSGALSDTKVAFTSFRNAASVLRIADLKSGTAEEVPTPYVHIQYMHGSAKHGKVVFLGEAPDAGVVLAQLALSKTGAPVLTQIFPPLSDPRPTSGLGSLSTEHISIGCPYTFTLPPDNRTCHVTYYPPRNADYAGGLEGEKPPVVVTIHGGPFYMEPRSLDWKKQFWTTRGYAQIDVNYGGSTGFGRAYRESLHGKWGVQDIADAHEAVLVLDKMGLVDAQRAVVHGGSAGGYAVLQIATSLQAGAFATGAAHYGISDMKKLADVLHKFEYWLCDRLMGGSWEECKDVWIERSPIYHSKRIQMPLLVLQGNEDTVINAEQMIEMVKELQALGKKAELLLFEGEGHGWRKSSTVRTTLEKELSWFSEVLELQNEP